MVQNIGSFYFDKTIAYYNDKNLEQFIKNMHIQILGYGRRQTDQTLTKIEDFSLPAFLIVYYEQGDVTLVHNGQSTELTPGSLYIFKPFELFSGFRTSEQPLSYKYIYFDIAPISARSIFISYAFGHRAKGFQQLWYHTAGANLLESAYEAGQRKVPGWHFMLQYAVIGIVAYTLYQNTSRITGKELLDQNHSAAIIDQAFAYMAQHLDKPIHIGELVQAIGTSHTTLNRSFQDIMEVSPVQAFTRYKLREASFLLQKGKSLKETARLLGYSSSGHLSATFKKVFGKSPRDYLNA